MKLPCGSEVYFVSEVAPCGAVANLTSLCTLVQNFTVNVVNYFTFALAKTSPRREKNMKDSELRTRAKTFALKIISVCDTIDTRKGRGVLVNQITRSSTSIGANIHEANYASSKADFINKFHIALKECLETEYWLDMLGGSNCITEETSKELLQECGVIRRMLVKSINTAKTNSKKQSEEN